MKENLHFKLLLVIALVFILSLAVTKLEKIFEHIVKGECLLVAYLSSISLVSA